MNGDRRNTLGYLRDRVVNAWWMLREGRLRQFVLSLWQELAQRGHSLGNTGPAQDELPRNRTAGDNPCRLTPASACPTQLISRTPHNIAASDDELAVLLTRFSQSDNPEESAQ